MRNNSLANMLVDIISVEGLINAFNDIMESVGSDAECVCSMKCFGDVVEMQGLTEPIQLVSHLHPNFNYKHPYMWMNGNYICSGNVEEVVAYIKLRFNMGKYFLLKFDNYFLIKDNCIVEKTVLTEV